MGLNVIEMLQPAPDIGNEVPGTHGGIDSSESEFEFDNLLKEESAALKTKESISQNNIDDKNTEVSAEYIEPSQNLKIPFNIDEIPIPTTMGSTFNLPIPENETDDSATPQFLAEAKNSPPELSSSHLHRGITSESSNTSEPQISLQENTLISKIPEGSQNPLEQNPITLEQQQTDARIALNISHPPIKEDSITRLITAKDSKPQIKSEKSIAISPEKPIGDLSVDQDIEPVKLASNFIKPTEFQIPEQGIANVDNIPHIPSLQKEPQVTKFINDTQKFEPTEIKPSPTSIIEKTGFTPQPQVQTIKKPQDSVEAQPKQNTPQVINLALLNEAGFINDNSEEDFESFEKLTTVSNGESELKDDKNLPKLPNINLREIPHEQKLDPVQVPVIKFANNSVAQITPKPNVSNQNTPHPKSHNFEITDTVKHNVEVLQNANNENFGNADTREQNPNTFGNTESHATEKSSEVYNTSKYDEGIAMLSYKKVENVNKQHTDLQAKKQTLNLRAQVDDFRMSAIKTGETKTITLKPAELGISAKIEMDQAGKTNIVIFYDSYKHKETAQQLHDNLEEGASNRGDKSLSLSMKFDDGKQHSHNQWQYEGNFHNDRDQHNNQQDNNPREEKVINTSAPLQWRTRYSSLITN